MSNNTRDPRRDPIPGDEIQNWKGVWRKVTKIWGADVVNVGQVGYSTNVRYKEQTCNIGTWRQWAKGAKVLKRGDEP